MPQLAPAADAMPRSGIRRVMDAAWKLDRPVIGLHVGEPSFDPPTHVVAAAEAAYETGDTHYTPNAGVGALRSAIADKLRSHNGLEVSPDQVVVTAGGAQALHVAFTATLTAGDEVLIPDPGWPNYTMAVGLLQAVPVGYSLRPENGFMPDFEELERLVTPRTRLIVVNTPSNPLGSVMSAEVVEALVRFADRHDIWLLSDECYDALTYEAVHTSPARFDGQGRVLSAFSFSKTYAMTGVRVGYLVSAPEFAPTLAKLQEPMIACVNAPAQAAALAALTGPQDEVVAMREVYRTRRDAVMAALDTLGIHYLTPHGAFYLWLDVSDRTDGDVATWAVRLLENEYVAVAPGTAFGPVGEGWIRLSLAADTDDLLEGVRRIGDFR
ncbi:aminotransferase class I/II-fold pyridoxal phosphate-dependent enzyme [Cnuibacter physcomitrellae]|uniref:pyridoxal phosphate-dependent aminotransferase n=1 Tax=Cnuibacter physcomitrellae TaxID=1619308 RepID=UPI002175F755|nr:aminotransferase class I/II-fold pyridoxal phosphate-dependent enzyme [Cnuibacter physcomitrellae]MCS5497606.1 aminotransferase class I/II-fold pyridoxal phosphate-dependent enzyme [Cnuibacter physcomitrellae]